MKKVVILLLIHFCCNNLTYSQEIYYLQGSSRKICQLVGDYDRAAQDSVQNLTLSNYQVWGTDLGVSFQHKNKTYLLFGDIPGDAGFGYDRDPIAYTEDADPDDGIDLTFITQSPGLYKPITIPGISQGAFEVPLDGLSIRDTMYIYHSTDNMSRSVLARSVDDGLSFELIVDTLSAGFFINISVTKVKRSDYPDLPGNFENGLAALGSGDYRNSAIYLFCQDEDSISYAESMHYFAGFREGKPVWSGKEEDAVPVINTQCAGELSFSYNPQLEKWLILYNCDNPRGIIYQTAEVPWGPYSQGEPLFDPWEDEAYCNYMHVNWESRVCDSVHDPGRENEWGGEYGPYLFEEMSTKVDSFVHLYYTLSTWNPYTTVLMRSTLVRPDAVSSGSERPESPEFRIYPNPTSGKFQLAGPGINESKLEVVLYTGTGRKILARKNTPEIDLSHFPAGIYFVRVLYQREYLYFLKIVKR